MKKAKNELLQFLAGLAMLIGGLFIFSQKVMVSSMFSDMVSGSAVSIWETGLSWCLLS